MPWSSYLVSLLTLELPPFTPAFAGPKLAANSTRRRTARPVLLFSGFAAARRRPQETRLVLSQPLKHSRRKEAQAAVAAFGTGFWGDGGMDRIHAETGGWPHLVQLIASTVVDLRNTQGRPHANAVILDEALAKFVVSGNSALAELMLYRSEEYPAAWSYLSGFPKQDTQPPPYDDALRLTLKRHLLVQEIAGGQWTLRVPLMQRWLRKRM